MAEDGQQIVSHYRLEEKLGEGGMGVVWKAHDTVLDRTVAIKALPPEAARDDARRAMFLKEARLASSVSDARIAQVYELGRHENLDFIVMEYVEGRPLDKILHGRPLPPDKVVALGEQIARALSRAHRKGLLHRDIKPANVLVTPDGEVKVVDFGLAALFRRPAVDRDDEKTQPIELGTGGKRSIVGTLPYMSPEELQGHAVDPRSDVFSLGVVLYEMATGVRPFAGATNEGLVQAIVTGRPDAPHDRVPKLPLELGRIIQKAIARRRADRYQSMEDLAVDLKRLGRELESGSSPSYDDVAKAAVPRTLPRAIAALVVSVVVLGALTWGSWRVLFAPSLAPDPRTVLVFPIEVRDQEAGAEYVGHAFAQELAVNLAGIERLNVLEVPEGRAADYAPDRRRRIARGLGAGQTLTGAVTRAPEVSTAVLSLVDSRGHIVWGATLQREDGDLSRLATSLARQLGEELGRLTPMEYDEAVATFERSPLATTPAGTAILAAWRQADYVAAADAAHELVTANPNDLDAQVMALRVYYTLWNRVGSEEAEARLVRTLTAVRIIDPTDPHAALWQASRDAFGTPTVAIEMLSDLLARADLTPLLRATALAKRAFARANSGDRVGSLEDLEEALRLAPASAEVYLGLSRTLSYLGDHSAAAARARQSIALRPFDSAGYQYLGLALSRGGNWLESLEPNFRACELSESQDDCALLSIALAQVGRHEEALLRARAAESRPTTPYGSYNLGCYYAVAGHTDEALRMLRAAVEAGYSSVWIEEDSDLESLHGEPEFEAIVEEIRRRVESD